MRPNDDNFAEAHVVNYFPGAKGHTKLIDEFHSYQRFPYCSSVKHDKIEFNQPDYIDPLHTVKTCYLKMTALVSEANRGIENLRLRG